MRKFTLLLATTVLLSGCGTGVGSLLGLGSMSATSANASDYQVLDVGSDVTTGGATDVADPTTPAATESAEDASQRAQTAFTRLDSNEDGGVSLAELKAAFAFQARMTDEAIKAMFDRIDTNHDSALSLSELDALAQQERKAGGPRCRAPQPPQGGHRGGPGGRERGRMQGGHDRDGDRGGDRPQFGPGGDMPPFAGQASASPQGWGQGGWPQFGWFGR